MLKNNISRNATTEEALKHVQQEESEDEEDSFDKENIFGRTPKKSRKQEEVVEDSEDETMEMTRNSNEEEDSDIEMKEDEEVINVVLMEPSNPDKNQPGPFNCAPITPSKQILSHSNQNLDDTLEIEKENEPRKLRKRSSMSTPTQKTETITQAVSKSATVTSSRSRSGSRQNTLRQSLPPSAGLSSTPRSQNKKRKQSVSNGSAKKKARNENVEVEESAPEVQNREEEGMMEAWELEVEEEDHEVPRNPRHPVQPHVLVIHEGLEVPKRIIRRAVFVRKYDFSKIPKICSEAIRGNNKGHFVRTVTYPGIPNKKFKKNQYDENDTNQPTDWPVQCLYPSSHKPNVYKILYEGWTNEIIGEQPAEDVEETANELVSEMKIRQKFYERIREIFDAEKDNFDDERMSTRKPTNRIWMYLDMSYFHSVQHKKMELAPIWYMNIMKTERDPPRFAYTPYNIMDIKSYNYCRQRKANTPWNELSNSSFPAPWKGYQGPCEMGNKCICNYRYTVLYGNENNYNGHRFTKNIIPRPDGTIDVSTFALSDTRVIIECSDACGCSSNCKRRQLQRGQSKPLVIFFENQYKGFGVRAAGDFKCGEFVCEYTGFARCNKTNKFETDEHVFKFATIGDLAEEKLTRKEADELEKRAKQEPDKAVLSDVETALNRKVLADNVKHNDMSYEAGFNLMDTSMVISANSVGNVARFINHSCDSNTAFMEVFSRRFESDTLIPRIAVYAIKDIAMGEEITTNYYANHDGSISSIKCYCKSTFCKKYLPDVRVSK